MISKVLFGIGYAGGIGLINAKRIKQTLFDNRFKKQKDQIRLGLEAAKVVYATKFIESSLLKVIPNIDSDLGLMWDPKDLRKAREEAMDMLSYQGFDNSVFDTAKMKLIEKYSSSEEITQLVLPN